MNVAKIKKWRTSWVIQCLRIRAFNGAGGWGSICDWGTNTPECHVVWPKIKKKKKKTETFQEIQELQLHAPDAGRPGSQPWPAN